MGREAQVTWEMVDVEAITQVGKHWPADLVNSWWEGPVTLETRSASFTESSGPAIPLPAPGDTAKGVHGDITHPCPRLETIKCLKQDGKIVAHSYSIVTIQVEESHHLVMVLSEAEWLQQSQHSEAHLVSV